MTQPAAEEVAPTARGDVDGRRRDVLAAAAALLDERTGNGFSMREVAEQAGVSAGAVYQWFRGKAEILAVLHAQRFEQELARIRALPDDIGFDDLVEDVLCAMAVNWADIGHHRTIIDATDPEQHAAFVDNLAESFRALTAEIERRFRTAAARESLELRPSDEMIPWFWVVCIGAGTQLIDARFSGAPSASAYIAGLAGPTAAGLVAPAPRPG